MSINKEVEVVLDNKELSFSFVRFYERYAKGIVQGLKEIDVLKVQELAKDLVLTRENGGQIFILGNGGSALNAQHFATDLAAIRYTDDQYHFDVRALTNNWGVFTAAANDWGYKNVFKFQLRSALTPLDTVIAISSSGNSENVVEAVKFANKRGALSWAIVGFDGGELLHTAKKSLYLPSKKGQYGFMEDLTSIISHIVTVFIQEIDKKNGAVLLVR